MERVSRMKMCIAYRVRISLIALVVALMLSPLPFVVLRGSLDSAAETALGIGPTSSAPASPHTQLSTTTSSVGWTQLSPATSPPARAGASMTYDAHDGYVLLFGGYQSGGTDLNDTWSYLHGTWTEITSTHSPSVRRYAAMAYDPAAGSVVLFGGSDPNAGMSDTWTFSNGEWTQIFPTTSPPARASASMVYDPAVDGLLLFGGTSNHCCSDAGLRDTWVFSDNQWTQLLPATSPPSVNEYAMTYDSIQNEVVLYGGWYPNGGCGNTVGGTWVFSDGTWAELSTSGSPGPRQAMRMAFDTALGYSVLFGGGNGTNCLPSPVFGDTWTYSSSGWTNLTSSLSTSPSARELEAMTYDQADGYILMFGGQTTSTLLGDAWTFGEILLSPSSARLIPVTGWASNSESCAIGSAASPQALFASKTVGNFNETSDLWNTALSSEGTATLCYEAPGGVGFEHVSLSMSNVADVDPTKSVAGYPSLQYGVCPWGEGQPPPVSPDYPLPLQSSAGLIPPVWPVVSYSVPQPVGSGIDFAYDIWLNPWRAPIGPGYNCDSSNAPESPAFYLEVMVWLNWENQFPAGSPVSAGSFETLIGTAISPQTYTSYLSCNSYGDTVSYSLDETENTVQATVGIDLQTVISDAISLANGCASNPSGTDFSDFWLNQIDLGQEFLPSAGSQVQLSWEVTAYCLVAGLETPSPLQLHCPPSSPATASGTSMVGPLTRGEAVIGIGSVVGVGTTLATLWVTRAVKRKARRVGK